VILADEKATFAAGQELAKVLRAGDVVTLSGPLSAGKTTFVRGLLAALGHRGEVPSPSFAIVQPYEGLSPPVWHVDLYRIELPSDVEELAILADRVVVLREGHVTGVLLSGMGRDGTDGAQSIVKAGGTIFAQDAATSAVWGMPRFVAESGIAAAVLPPEELAERILATSGAEAWQ